MKASEFREKTIVELDALLIEKRTEHIVTMRSLAAGELPNTRVVRKNRREIARILTSLTQARQIEASKGDA